MKRWRLPSQVHVPSSLRRAVGGHPIVARLLAQRGILDPKEALAFLDPQQYEPAPPEELPNLSQALSLVRRSISAGERIRVWGDFDADGQTATAVLVEALRALGANVDFQLPRRGEGHGFHPRAVQDALKDGVALLLTCDTGIGDGSTVRLARDAGLAVIVTDHHDLPSELPPADAVVNPKMLPLSHPLRELSGVGVAYMLARGLLEPTYPELLEGMLDLVALGLIADVAVQVHDVRYLIQRGLEVFRLGKRPGLRALLQVAGLDPEHVDEQIIGYQLGPRMNAAGRLVDSEFVVQLLLTRDPQEALALAQKLEALNRERQVQTEIVLTQVEERLSKDPQWLHQPAIVLSGKNWEPGVLGLVASELVRRYGRPAILISHRDGGPSVGSARSIEGVDIHEAIADQKALLLREGGHPMAAGFSLESQNVPLFTRQVLSWLQQHVSEQAYVSTLPIDMHIPWGEITLELARELLRLAPFGAGNPPPVFMATGGTLIRVEDVSSRRETPHRRLFVTSAEGKGLRFIWFDAQNLPQIGGCIDLAFRISIDYWQGREYLQLELVDWRPSEELVQREVSTLVAGREIIDWRQEKNREALLTKLQSVYKKDLLLWVENPAIPLQGGYTRAQLQGKRCVALGVVTPPPGPEALRWVIREVQPQVIYLLPPLAVTKIPANELVRQVAAMLRTALERHEGWLDVLRMAARLGVRRATVVAALEGLEAAGKIALRYEEGRLRAYLPQQAPSDQQRADPLTDEELQQAKAALLYLLRETQAYRQAYREQPLGALFI
ncbi:MAG: single-stranded-DNA-specific exonuclease RecJ [Anaerolineae bacterium]|nr:single-stranded-DNA-specific exonuclease RecJ [Anaerolineae bacterium]